MTGSWGALVAFGSTCPALALGLGLAGPLAVGLAIQLAVGLDGTVVTVRKGLASVAVTEQPVSMESATTAEAILFLR
ncbi:hypothetical protein QFZ23_001930 [Arthrobacter globiformis]|nr:hypothetical protein [Arthrobacter globiformis]MDQ1058029.1 hypothetical protein [Arthrobacter globiformis]